MSRWKTEAGRSASVARTLLRAAPLFGDPLEPSHLWTANGCADFDHPTRERKTLGIRVARPMRLP